MIARELPMLIACGKIVSKDGRLSSPKVKSLIGDRQVRSEAARTRANRRWGKQMRQGKLSRSGHNLQSELPSDNSAALMQGPCEVEEEVEVEEERGSVITKASTSGFVGAVAKAQAPTVPATKRATMVPTDWCPSAAMIEYAIEQGLTEQEARDEGKAMVNWASANGKRKFSWDATYQNWCRTTMQRRGQYKRPHERKSVAQMSHDLPLGFGGRNDDTGRKH
jgi:hypothetical protein